MLRDNEVSTSHIGVWLVAKGEAFFSPWVRVNAVGGLAHPLTVAHLVTSADIKLRVATCDVTSDSTPETTTFVVSMAPTAIACPLEQKCFLPESTTLIAECIQNLVHELKESQACGLTTPIDAPAVLPESRVLCLYTGGTIGMKSEDGGEHLEL
ncbi:hypothetical protein GCK32_021554 [Trichostrongylus colubriformis]|uniref:Asparaginase n=1 Tax=Trichostrongylus colubriformis TaxID=6319 RepID=A0AAN8FTJ0_TRICO